MKMTDINYNDKVTFKHGDHLQYVDTGVVFYKEEYHGTDPNDSDTDGYVCILHVEVKELDEVFEVIESEILKTWTMDEERQELCEAYERMGINNYGPMVDRELAETFIQEANY